jgi:hypothetical protein
VALVVAAIVVAVVPAAVVAVVVYAAVVTRAPAVVVAIATSESRAGDQGGSSSRDQSRCSEDPSELAVHAYPP